MRKSIRRPDLARYLIESFGSLAEQEPSARESSAELSSLRRRADVSPVADDDELSRACDEMRTQFSADSRKAEPVQRANQLFHTLAAVAVLLGRYESRSGRGMRSRRRM